MSLCTLCPIVFTLKGPFRRLYFLVTWFNPRLALSAFSCWGLVAFFAITKKKKKDPQLVYSTIPQVEIAIRIFSIFRSIRIREIVTRITSWEHMSFLIVDGTVVLFPFAFWLILVFIMERCGLGLECYVMFGYCKYHFLLYKKEAFYLTMTRNSVL